MFIPFSTAMILVIALFMMGVLTLIFFIRERKNARMFQQHTEELERLRNDFTSMIIHDLKTPIDGIKKMAELLERPHIFQDAKERRNLLQLIQMSASNMFLLVSDLLDVARMDEGKFPIVPTQGSIRDVVARECTSLAPLAEGKGIQLSSFFPHEYPEFSFDARRVAQVVNNFLSNALRFTPAGGSVRVGLLLFQPGQSLCTPAEQCGIPWKVFPLDDALAHLPKSVVLTVLDTGRGIPKEQLKILFTKWQRLNSPHEHSEGGTGLGLVIVKGIIEAHHGTVGVVSEEGQGSLFYCTLPIGNTPIVNT